jgi:hypothetical protein
MEAIDLRIIYLQRKQSGLLPEGYHQSGVGASVGAREEHAASTGRRCSRKRLVVRVVSSATTGNHRIEFSRVSSRNSSHNRPRCWQTKFHDVAAVIAHAVLSDQQFAPVCPTDGASGGGTNATTGRLCAPKSAYPCWENPLTQLNTQSQ